MKKLIFILMLIPFISFGQSATPLWAINYFGEPSDTSGTFVSTVGSDAATGTFSDPFATITHALTNRISDTIWVRGGEYHEYVDVGVSGSIGDSIYLMAYGNENVYITGEKGLSSFAQNGNEYTSSLTIPVDSLNVVVVGGELKPMGREPDGYWWTVNGHSGYAWMKSDSLNSGVTDWTGARTVSKDERWIASRRRIDSTNVDSVFVSWNGGYDFKDNYGFFIQDDIRTLDNDYEWFFNRSTKKATFYYSGSVQNAFVADMDTLMAIIGQSYIKIKGINFQYANKYAVYLEESPHITFDSCNFKYCYDAIVGQNYESNGLDPLAGQNLMVKNSTFNQIVNNAVWLNTEFSNYTVKNNSFADIATMEGMGGSIDGTYTANRMEAVDGLITRNTYTRIGYQPITFKGNTEVSFNFIDTYCYVKDDGGGIYTANASNGRWIHHNIILNGLGAPQGTGSKVNPWDVVGAAEGIYLDNGSNGVLVEDNTVGNVRNQAIFAHNSTQDTFRRNTLHSGHAYNSGGISMQLDNTSYPTMQNMVFEDNTVVVMQDGKNVFYVEDADSSAWTAGSFDNNFYAALFDGTGDIFKWKNKNVSSTQGDKTAWTSFNGQDGNSVQSDLSVPDSTYIPLEYNATFDSIYFTFDTDAEYFDGTVKLAGDSVQIAPFESITYVIRGHERITNGNFADGSWWSIPSVIWSIGSGVASYNGGAYFPLVAGSEVFENGVTYQISFDLSVSAGSLDICASNVDGSTFSSLNSYNSTQSVTFEYTHILSPLNYICFLSQSSFIGAIDNVSVREIY